MPNKPRKEYGLLGVRIQTIEGKQEVCLLLEEELPEYVEKNPWRLQLILDDYENTQFYFNVRSALRQHHGKSPELFLLLDNKLPMFTQKEPSKLHLMLEEA
ncbi:hypothetical protein FACS1894208_11120 [Clostridia bacterium]|nr:hypothetical protein FACS1894208_11120 [Clostridia bacterium]